MARPPLPKKKNQNKTQIKNKTLILSLVVAILSSIYINIYSPAISPLENNSIDKELNILKYWNLKPIVNIRQHQWVNIFAELYVVKDTIANAVLSTLDVHSLCGRLCQVHRNSKYLEMTVGSSPLEFPCRSKADILKSMPDVEMEYRPKNFAIVVPLFRDNNIEQYMPTFQSHCTDDFTTTKQPLVDLVVLMPSSSKTQQANIASKIDLLSKCFSPTVITTAAINGHPANKYNELSLFLHLISNSTFVDEFKYLFWMKTPLKPTTPNWLQRLERETLDSSPFFIKGTPDTSIKSTDGYLQQLTGYSPTEDSFQMDGNVFVGLWNSGFVNLTLNFLSTTLDYQTMYIEDSIAKVMVLYMIHTQCHFKFFMPYVQYRNIVSLRGIDQSAIFSRLDAVTTQKDTCNLNALENKDGIKPTQLEYWFNHEEIACGKNMKLEEYNLLMENRFNMSQPLLPALRNTCLGKMQTTAFASKRKQLEQHILSGTACDVNALHDSEDTSSASTAETSDSSTKGNKILVTIVFGKSQYKNLLYSLARWELPAYMPCSFDGKYKNTQQKPSILFLQSGTEDEDVLDDLKKDAPQFPSLARCFSNLHYTFISLPQGQYADGPPNMFKEMILGNVSREYDYVLQMEPDVFPIRPLWMEKVAEETLDTTTFHVKGSTGLYYDQPDFEGSCLTGKEVNTTHAIESTPLGFRMLHINGNALYTLSAAFIKYVEGFYAWAEKIDYNLLCPRIDRIHCDPNTKHCTGSFDTSFAEYAFETRDKMAETLVNYRYSTFIVNSLHPQYFPGCTPRNAYLIHKPWVFFAQSFDGWAKECRVDEDFFKEYYWYNAYGAPEYIIQSFNPSDVKGYIDIMHYMDSVFKIM